MGKVAGRAWARPKLAVSRTPLAVRPNRGVAPAPASRRQPVAGQRSLRLPLKFPDSVNEGRDLLVVADCAFLAMGRVQCLPKLPRRGSGLLFHNTSFCSLFSRFSVLSATGPAAHAPQPLARV